MLQKRNDDVYWLLGLPPDETPFFALQEQQGASDHGREAARLLPTTQDCVRTKEQHDEFDIMKHLMIITVKREGVSKGCYHKILHLFS